MDLRDPSVPMDFVENMQGNLLLEALNTQRDSGRFCDIVFHVNNHQYQAHRNVLAACSPYFDTVLDMNKLSKEHLSVVCNDNCIFETLLDYMYRGRVTINKDNASELLRLANHFMITKLKEHCAEYLERSMSVSNCFAIKEMADRCDCPTLAQNTHYFILCNISEVVSQSEILEFPLEKLENFLANKLYTVTQEEQFKLILRWVKYDLEERESDFKPLLSHINWSCFNNDLICNALKSNELFKTADSCIINFLQVLEENQIDLGFKSDVLFQDRSKLEEAQGDFSTTPRGSEHGDGAGHLNKKTHKKRFDIFGKPTLKEGDWTLSKSKRDGSSSDQLFGEDDETDTEYEDGDGNVTPDKAGRPHKRKGIPIKMALSEDKGYLDGKYSQSGDKDDDDDDDHDDGDDDDDDEENEEDEMERKVRVEEPLATFNEMDLSDAPAMLSSDNESHDEKDEDEEDEGDEEGEEQEYREEDIKPPSTTASSSLPTEIKEKKKKKKKNPKKKFSRSTPNMKGRRRKDRLKCSKCEFETCNQRRYNCHMASAHKSEQVYTCSICKFTCTYNMEYYKHMKSHFDGPPYHCDDANCSFSAERIQSLMFHRMKHTDERPFRCSFCNQAFRTKGNLKTHRRCHTGEKPFKCEVCMRCFAAKGTLDQHSVTHSDHRPYLCELCGFSTKYQSHLILHRRVHKGDVYKCQQPNCEYTTPRRAQLACHMRIHMQIKAHVCSTCGRAFTERSHLLRHERIHLDVKPFQCEHCDYSSTRRDKLNDHTKRHHGGGAGGSSGGGEKKNTRMRKTPVNKDMRAGMHGHEMRKDVHMRNPCDYYYNDPSIGDMDDGSGAGLMSRDLRVSTMASLTTGAPPSSMIASSLDPQSLGLLLPTVVSVGARNEEDEAEQFRSSLLGNHHHHQMNDDNTTSTHGSETFMGVPGVPIHPLTGHAIQLAPHSDMSTVPHPPPPPHPHSHHPSDIPGLSSFMGIF